MVQGPSPAPLPAPSFPALVSLLRLFASSHSISETRALHLHLRGRRLHGDPILGGLLVQIYGDCGSLGEAADAFACIHPRSVFSWNVMMRAYAKQREEDGDGVGLASLRQMQQEGLHPNAITWVSFLAICSSSSSSSSVSSASSASRDEDEEAIQEGRRAHVCIREGEHRACVMVRNGVLNMYAKKGSVREAGREFEEMDRDRNVVTWTSMMSALMMREDSDRRSEVARDAAEASRACRASRLFRQMQQEGASPDSFAFRAAIDACRGEAWDGKRIHACIIAAGLSSGIALGASVAHMYGESGHLERMRAALHDVPARNAVLWSVAIGALARSGRADEASQLFERMKGEGIAPNSFAAACMMGAIAGSGMKSKARRMHATVLGARFGRDLVRDAAVLGMYGRCRSVEDCLEAFGRLDAAEAADAAPWSALLAALARNHESVKALACLVEMIQRGIAPSEGALASAIEACAKGGCLQRGRCLHVVASEARLLDHLPVGNAVVGMYARCGSLREAARAFSCMRSKDRVTWNTLLAACARHGQADAAMDAFRGMLADAAAAVDELSLLSLLSSCRHAGLVDEGLCCFFALTHRTRCNSTDGANERARKHYNSAIDLLARAGRLDEAERLAQVMPPRADLVSLLPLLGACKQPGDVLRGERIASWALRLNLDGRIANVVLSKICRASGEVAIYS